MKKRIVLVMVFTAFQGLIHNLGHPVTPDLVKSLEIPDFMFGVFFAAMSLGLMIGSPIFGVLGDKYKKNWLIFIGLIIYSTGQIAFGFGTNMKWMTFFRIISGLGVSAIVTLLVSYIIEQSTPENKTRNLAAYTAILTFFAGLGYKVGGFLNNYEPLFPIFHLDLYSHIFLLHGILNIILAFAILFFLKEDNVQSVHTHKIGFFSSFSNLKKLDTELIIFLIAVTLVSMASINLGKYLDVYFIYLGYDSNQLGNFVLVTGVVSLFTSFLIVPFVKRLDKELLVLMVIQVLSGIIVLFVFRQSMILLFLYTLYNLYVLLKAIYIPFEQNFISNYATNKTIGLFMGVRQSFVSIGMIIGPLIGGIFYNMNPIYVFDMSAILFFISFVMLLVISKKLKKRKATQ